MAGLVFFPGSGRGMVSDEKDTGVRGLKIEVFGLRIGR